MTAIEDILRFSAETAAEDTEWGKPAAYSGMMHALVLSLFITCWLNRGLPPEPVKVLEINVMGLEDRDLAGTGSDPSRGPMADKTLLADAPKKGGAVVRGNTARLSQALTARPVPALTAKGPLFGSTDGREGGAEPGVGREKIYLKTSAARLAKSAGGAGGGEGLVGVSGGPVDLKARRGTGGDGSGRGNFLSGGVGTVGGGSQLMRKGESIVVRSPNYSEDMVGHKTAKVALPEPSDDFFSIRGPLSRRKILKLSLPRYPRWAEEQGVEAQVSVWLSVTANGRVKTNLYVEQTSGYPAFDRLALETIEKMQFAPLPDVTSSQEESGVATFNFTLRKTIAKKGDL